VNPVFVLPAAAETQSATIADRLVASLTNSNGQMCTCPGLIFGVRSSGLENILRDIAESLDKTVPQPMLNSRVRAAYARRVAEVSGVDGVDLRGGSPNAGHIPLDQADQHEAGQPIRCSPALFRATYATFRRSPTLHEEVFGPAAIAVICESDQELAEAAAAIHGSLTGTIWASASDEDLARRLGTVLESRVGRLIYNGVPTGVEVCASMVAAHHRGRPVRHPALVPPGLLPERAGLPRAAGTAVAQPARDPQAGERGVDGRPDRVAVGPMGRAGGWLAPPTSHRQPPSGSILRFEPITTPTWRNLRTERVAPRAPPPLRPRGG
jgi:hypothetical protein